jgi:hypothetical protein
MYSRRGKSREGCARRHAAEHKGGSKLAGVVVELGRRRRRIDAEAAIEIPVIDPDGMQDRLVRGHARASGH